MQGDTVSLHQLDNILVLYLREDHLKLVKLYEKFKNFRILPLHNCPDQVYKHTFGFFVSEYLRDLNVLDE